MDGASRLAVASEYVPYAGHRSQGRDLEKCEEKMGAWRLMVEERWSD